MSKRAGNVGGIGFPTRRERRMARIIARLRKAEDGAAERRASLAADLATVGGVSASNGTSFWPSPDSFTGWSCGADPELPKTGLGDAILRADRRMFQRSHLLTSLKQRLETALGTDSSSPTTCSSPCRNARTRTAPTSSRLRISLP